MTETNHDVKSEIEKLKEDLERKTAEAEEYRKEIEELKEQLKEQAIAEENYKYKLAEIDNYRKQLQKESEIILSREIEKFLMKLINLRDDYERAMQSTNSADNPALVKGLESILKNLTGMLKEEGVKEIEATGKPFDPHVHEAITFVDSKEYPANTVTAEIRKGYMLSDRVIRPTLVEVSKKDNSKSNGG